MGQFNHPIPCHPKTTLVKAQRAFDKKYLLFLFVSRFVDPTAGFDVESRKTEGIRLLIFLQHLRIWMYSFVYSFTICLTRVIITSDERSTVTTPMGSKHLHSSVQNLYDYLREKCSTQQSVRLKKSFSQAPSCKGIQPLNEKFVRRFRVAKWREKGRKSEWYPMPFDLDRHPMHTYWRRGWNASVVPKCDRTHRSAFQTQFVT